MENNKKLSLDDIFGKPSNTQQPQSKMDLETIFGKKVEPASVAPEGTTIDSMRNMSIAPISLPKVELERQGVIGEDVLQASRSAFEKEIAADQGPIFPPKQDYAPLNPASIKIGRAMPEVGSVDKPKNLQQTVRSEISKEWGGDLRKFVEDTHKVPAENIQMANDMEAHFWNVMTDKLPKDGFISQEDMDPYSFVRKYDNGDEVTEYSLGHYTYPQEVVNEYIARHNDEVLHEMRFKDDAAYRNDWFLRNVGVTEQVYRDEIADDLENRLQELRKKIVATLPAQHTRGGYAAIGAAANKPSSGAPVSIEKIDKALKVVNTLRKNNFGAGLKEGFDPADILTLGVSGIGENVALLNALNKSTSGKTLTNAEQALVEAWDIQNEAEEVINTLGGRTLGANIGRGSAMSLGFVTQTLGTSGIASLATKGISRAAARTALRRAANTGLSNQIKEGLRYGGLKVVESAVGAAARTPFMGFTYRNYTDKRLDQFQVKERLNQATGEVGKYIDKQDASALRDAVHTALESFFESQSEDVGGLIDFGITSFARALPLNKMIRSAAINGLTGPVQSGAMRWLRESAKIYGLAGETLSEAYGDAMVNLLTSNSDGWKQMATSEYWWELIGVSSMLSGGFGVVNRGVNWVNNREISRDISKSEQLLRNSLSRIEDDNLKKELTEATLTDDVIDRSKRLSSLDWSNFSREDIANAVDFIDAQTRLDVMREGATESRRLARIMPAIDEVKKLVDGGALDDEQAAASLATIYSDLFRTQENQRALNILTDRIKVAADAGISADKINDILRGAGLTVFNPGDEIETLTGDRAIVDKVLPGAYEVVNNEGDRAVVSFEEVLQNTPEVRQIQQESNQTEGQTESVSEINPQVEQAVESARQEAEVIKNLDDDVIYEATLSDGTPVNIIKGANIVYNNQTGEVDYDASDATVVVRSNDGSKRQISIRDIDSIDQAMSVDEALEVATAAATEVVNSQEQAETPTAEIVSTQDEGPSAQEAEAATVEQSSESPANQPEEQSQIPTLKNGDPDYNAMDAQMFTEQYVARFGEDMTERVARNNIKASNKTISNIEKQIEDVTDPNKMPALYSKLQDAQATKDKYVAVLEELGLSSDESEDNAARVQRKKQENTSWFNKLFPDGFPNVESVILWDIANGNRIRWANKEVNGAVVSKGLGSHLGLADSNAERTRRIALIGKDAPTPEEYAEQLPERLKAMGVRFEEGELRDKVLDVYASVDTVRKAKEELEKISANIQSEQEGLDYEEEQMRRNYEREQEALRQEAQADVVDEQTEQGQPTNEETQEEELSIEDEVSFMVSSDSVQATTEAQKLAKEAAITALEDAGVEVVNATPEMVEEALQRKDVQMQAVNQRFNEQLDSFTEENANAVIFDLGMPSPMLIAGGVPNKPIRLYGSKLLKKIRKHGFSATELSGLPMALANPIAVFNNYQREGNRSVLTELSTADGNFLVSIDIGMGSDIDFDIVKSVFGKDGDGILNWINKGYLTTVDKEKALAYLRISAPIAEASDKQELDSATKIVENFENPKIVPDNSVAVEDPSLIGLHNISEEKLRKAFRVGALVNPSVAVIDANSQRHTGYGNITFVLPSSMIAKKTGKNIGTYFGDAWTPTYPQIVRKLGNNVASQDIMSVPEEMRSQVRMSVDNWLDGRSAQSLAYLFLYQRGEAPEMYRVQPQYSEALHNAMSEITKGQAFYYLTPEQRNQVLELYIQEKHGSREAFDAHIQRALDRSQKFLAERGANSLVGRKAQEVIDTIGEYGYDYDAVSGFVSDVLRDMEQSGVVDSAYTMLQAEQKVKSEGFEREFERWLDSLEDRYEIKEVIFKGFTPSGNRRYVPHTAENASKEMRSQGRAGATGFGVGFSRFAATLLKPGTTLEDIRKRRGQLTTSEEKVEAFKEKWGQVFFDLGIKCQPGATGYEDYGIYRLTEAAQKKDPQAYLKNEYGVELSDEDAKRLQDMIKAIRTEYPVMYFETKFERPVYFNEFAGAVVPDNASADVIQSLKDAGVPVWVYAASDENARMNVIKSVANSSDDIFFSIGPAPVFVSNAKIAVLGIKQDKATPEQWLKMIEKAGGLKAGEDKWIGLSDWLKASDKKTLTKQEVLDYINENQIQIEEVKYSEFGAGLIDQATEKLDAEMREIGIDAMREKYPDFDNYFELFDGELVWSENNASEGEYEDYIIDNHILDVDPTQEGINETRLGYTTDGLDNKREIALTVPTIAPWNEYDEIHFGDAGDGRAIAWIRFGETVDEYGFRVLVIDEIQSKRHQDGREKGYRPSDVDKYLKDNNVEVVETGEFYEFYRDGELDRRFSKGLLHYKVDEAKKLYVAGYNKSDIPEAPFEKNWVELAMKRMLRYAAENGYDAIAWTKGDQQAERYDIGSVVEKVVSYTEDGAKTVRIYLKNNEPLNLKVDSDGKILYSNRLTVSAGQNLSDVVGKDVAVKILRGDGEDATIYAGKGKEYAAKQLLGNGLRIGGEGMRAFYDQILPSFMNKYGKKWGVKVQDVTLPFIEEAGRTMHSVDVTDSMRESVMEGQPMFYRRPNGIVYGWTNGTTVYLTESGMNPNTPIHEYTHIWSDAMRKHNPEGWASIVKLLKGTPVWNEVMADTNYANIHGDENKVASEALSRISGRENSAKMEAMAQLMIDENANDTVKKNRARKLLDRMRKALQEFWSWVGKELFGIKNFERIEQVTDRILYDLVSGTDLNPESSFDTSAAERAETIRASKANGTYLKAPNGKDTNLAAEQWVTVRTKAFKRWFGDWENGGASSQILDANGEPLVVWHGGEFATDEFVANGSMHFGTKVAALQRILDNSWGYGNWTVGRNAEGRWSWKYTDPDDTGHDKQGETAFALPIDALVDAAHVAAPNAVVRPYYLNIRNLERTEDQNSDWGDAVSFSMDAGYDGIIYRNEFEDEGEDSYVAFYPNQIKLAEGNTTFDPNDDDVRFNIERDNESEDDLSIVEHKMTPLARLEAERDMLLENRENNPNFEQEYEDVENRIREEKATDHVALTSDAGFESEEHRVAVEDALFDYIRENELFASQMYVVNNYDSFIEKIKELFPRADISALDPSNRAIYRDGMIVIRADAIDTRVTGIAKLMHEYTHALTVENLSNNSFYRRMLQIAKQVGAPYMVARLEGYEDLGIDKSDSGLVDGLMELLARDMEFVVRNGRLDEFLASEDASEVVLREYFEKYDVPQPLTELLIEIATEIRSIKYGKINLNQKGYRATQSSLLRTSRGNDGANLSSDARDYERGGVFRRSRTHESDEGASADSGGEVGEGSRGYRADLANSQEQTTRSDKNKQLIAELRAKLRDSKAEVKTVAAEVSKLVRKSMTPELVEKLGKRTFDGIVKIIEDATVRRDLEYAVNRIEEVVLDLEIKDNQDKFNKFLDLRIQGESARGVSVAANVTDQTRQYITIIRDNLDRPASEVAALIEERGGTLAERTGLQVLEFYQDAKEHAHEVDDIEHDIAEIKVKNTKLRKDRAALNKAGKTVEARKLSEEIEQNKQLIENLNSERIMTKRSQLYYLGMAAGELEKEIAYGKEGHKEWLQTEVERKQQLINIAWNDIRDGKKIPILDQERSIWQKGADAIKDFLLAPAYSWDYLLKMISVNAPGGEGALYDHFMRSEYGYVESAAKYWTSYNDFKDQLNKKAQEIFGKDYKQVLKDSNQALDVQIQLAAQYAKTHAATDENTKIREGASEVYTPTIGEVLYAYMAYKMADGKVKLDKMGLTEDKIDMLVRMIPQQYIDFAEWIQDEFLPERRKAYNKTHLEVFGTQMAQVENYVPLRVKKDFVYEEFDGSKVDTPQLPSSITGSIIKRKRNSLPIDLHTNVFDLMLDHGQQMEHWNAYTRIVRDTNQFLSNTKIRRALNFRNPSLHKKLKEAALIASNSYQPDVDKMEKMTVALSKMAASSKIAFRINTAIKQVLSYPAFYAYVADAHFWGYLTRNLSPDTWGRNFRWALDNIPSFQERWLGRMAGDDRLAQMTAPKLDQWIKRMGSLGMFSNALVDAMTCANGAQAVYRYEYERYKKAGMDDTEADRMAKIAAAQAINQTQQSSEGMYLSRIQADRTFFAVALSTFQNSNFAYLRKELEGIDQLFRKTEKQIANRTRYYEDKGLSTDQAAKLAAEEVVRANRTAVAKILTFTFILNTIWTLGNSVWKFAFGDEDEEDTWQQATIRGFLNSWTRNLSIGQYVETLAWSDFRELNPSLLLSDLNTFMDRIEKIAEGKVKVWDRTAAWTTLSIISSMGVGVDINSFASMYEGVAGAIDNGINVEDVMLFVNAPRSQAKFIAGPPKEGESLDEYTKRQAWIERKIMSRVDKKQLDKWSRNYEAYKQAKMLGTPHLQDKTGAVKVPYIQEIEASYTDMLRRIGRTKAGDKRPDSEKLSDRTTQKVKELDMVRRIKAINDLEKQFEAMVVMNEVYEARLKELCRAKQDLVNTWNK